MNQSKVNLFTYRFNIRKMAPNPSLSSKVKSSVPNMQIIQKALKPVFKKHSLNRIHTVQAQKDLARVILSFSRKEQRLLFPPAVLMLLKAKNFLDALRRLDNGQYTQKQIIAWMKTVFIFQKNTSSGFGVAKKKKP